MSEHPILVDIRIYWRYSTPQVVQVDPSPSSRMRSGGPQRAGTTSAQLGSVLFLSRHSRQITTNMGLLSWFKKVRSRYLIGADQSLTVYAERA
jgi:hypothetical protein